MEDCVHIGLESLMKYLGQSKKTLLLTVRKRGVERAEKKEEKPKAERNSKRIGKRMDYIMNSK